jgi:hypothetical protein
MGNGKDFVLECDNFLMIDLGATQIFFIEDIRNSMHSY